MFQKWHPTDHLNTIERVYMLGKDTCVINKWSAGGLKGYVTTINVREGDNWLFRIATVSLTPAPATTGAATPSNTPDPQLREKLVAAVKKHTDALDKNDAAAVATNFTEEGILVTPGGPISGREAIEKHYADDFKQGFHSSNNIATPDEDSPHMIGTAGNEMWATGRWSATIQGKDWGPIPATGYWSVIREGDDWKIRMLAFNVTPPPAATPSPTASPSNK